MGRYPKVICTMSLVLLMGFLLLQCSSPGGGSGSVTTAQATIAVQAAGGSVMLLLNRQQLWKQTGGSSPYTVSYSTTGLSMTGTLTVVGSDNNYSLTMALSNYSDAATGYTVSGTANLSLTMGPSGASVTLTGDATLSGGPVTKETWNLLFTATGPMVVPTVTGTITCDGKSFDANTLMVNYFQANVAQFPIVNAIQTIVKDPSSWTWNGTNPYTVSYSPATGPSMAGTVTKSGPSDNIWACVLTISFSGYSAAGWAYTVNGVVNFSPTIDASDPSNLNFISGTLTGNLTLSGGSVTSMTWNVSDVSNSKKNLFFTGTVTCNGTSIDAKTFGAP